jgi:hypothetical protein
MGPIYPIVKIHLMLVAAHGQTKKSWEVVTSEGRLLDLIGPNKSANAGANLEQQSKIKGKILCSNPPCGSRSSSTLMSRIKFRSGQHQLPVFHPQFTMIIQHLKCIPMAHNGVEGNHEVLLSERGRIESETKHNIIIFA